MNTDRFRKRSSQRPPKPRSRVSPTQSTSVFGPSTRHAALTDYENHLRWERGLSEATIQGYRSSVVRFIRYLDRHGSLGPESATRRDVRSFVRYLTRSDRVTGNTVRSVISGVRSF